MARLGVRDGEIAIPSGGQVASSNILKFPWVLGKAPSLQRPEVNEMVKVLISDSMSPRAKDIFDNRGIDVDVKVGLSEDELKRLHETGVLHEHVIVPHLPDAS